MSQNFQNVLKKIEAKLARQEKAVTETREQLELFLQWGRDQGYIS